MIREGGGENVFLYTVMAHKFLIANQVAKPAYPRTTFIDS